MRWEFGPCRFRSEQGLALIREPHIPRAGAGSFCSWWWPQAQKFTRMQPTWAFSGNSSPEFSGCRWFEKKKSCEGSHSWEAEFCSFLECELFDFLKRIYWQSTWCSFPVLFTVGGFLLKPSPHKNSAHVITGNLLSCFANICFPNMLFNTVSVGHLWEVTVHCFYVQNHQEARIKPQINFM